MRRSERWIYIAVFSVFAVTLFVFAVCGLYFARHVHDVPAGSVTVSILERPSSPIPSLTPSPAPSASRLLPEESSRPETSAEEPDLPVESEPAPEVPSSAGPEQPQELLSLLDEANCSIEALSGIRQLVIVRGSGSSAQVFAFEQNGGQWSPALPEASGFVGRDGVGQASESTAHTPQGMYSLDFAFGNAADPGTAMEYRPVNETVYWVDDPASQYYNQWVDAAQIEVCDWNSAEHLASVSVYAYAVAIGYNHSCTPGQGSAFFLHCSDGGPTAGCVSVDEAVMVALLRWLDPSASPCILMFPS